MAARRLAALTPLANVDTEFVISDVTAIASILVTNTSTTPAEVTAYVKPVEDLGNSAAYSYLIANLSLTAGQSFETFRFPITVGDVVQIQATTAAINFTLNAVFENQGGQNVIYSSSQPLYPNVGDIWVSSIDQNVSLWTGDSWNSIALNAPAGPQGDTGPIGPQGEQGLPGPGFRLSGTVPTVASLPAFGQLPDSEVNDNFEEGYYVEETGTVFLWKATGWVDVGPVTGPTGPRTTTLTIIGAVETADLLPSPFTEPDDQNAGTFAYFVTAEEVYYGWTGTEWVNVGRIQGDTGPAGPQGDTGPVGPQGFALNLTGSVDNVSDLDSITPNTNDAYYVVGLAQPGDDPNDLPDSGIYLWTGTEWVKIEYFEGPTGPTGDTGPVGPTGDASVYTPETTVNWNNTPTTIAEALDELAARVKALEP